MNEIIEQPPNPYPQAYPLPTELPTNALEAIWIVSMAIFPVCVWGIKSFIDTKIESIREMDRAKLEEFKKELEQRDELIDHIQKQNAILINEIFIMRRTLDFSGELEVKNNAVK